MFPIRDTVPRRFPPVMVWTLIFVNSAVFLFQIRLAPQAQEWLLYHYALVPARYSDPVWALAHGLRPDDYLPFLTNTFMHGGWFHLIGNMWFLWIFGSAVEDRMGPWRFLGFYLACGVLASVAHYLINTDSQIPALGASGATSGVMGAYTALFPLARILFVVPVFVFPFFFEWPALLFTGFWFVLQFLQGAGELLAPRMGGGVAWWAHVGGFVAGLAMVRFLTPAWRRRYHPDEGVYGHGPRGELR